MLQTTGEPVLHKNPSTTYKRKRTLWGACKKWLFNNETSFNPATF